ncbi:MAG TPA: tetratricopeptide repeat protein, partial [Armatimonadetes bacterium]|nr:tetratricopeptide repeat protein [Armatimonadota bacterium]
GGGCIGVEGLQIGNAVDKGWILLRDNDLVGAQAAFAAATEKQPTAAKAWRGLGWVYSLAGDDAAAWEAWRQALERTASETEAQVYLFLAFDAARTVGRYREFVTWAEKLSTTATSDQRFPVVLRFLLSEAYDALGEPERAEAVLRPLRPITKWLIVGPFDNPSHLGFDAVYPPEQTLDLRRPMTGKGGRRWRWFSPGVAPRRGWLPLAAFWPQEANTVGYALTFVHSPQAQPIYLKVGATGAVKVWLNGRELVRAPEAMDTGPDAFVVPTVLRRGWSRILVKVAVGGEPARILVRLTARDGTPLRNVSYRTDPYDTPDESDRPPPVPRLPAWDVRQQLTARLQADPDEMETWLCLDLAHRVHGDLRAALTLEERAVQRWPQAGLWHLRLARTCEALGRWEEARGAYQRATELNPDLASAQLGTVQQLAETDRAAAKARLEELAQRFPRDFRFPLAQAQLAEAAGEAEEVAAALQKAVERNPGGTELHFLRARALLAQQQWTEGSKALERAIASEHSAPAPRLLRARWLLEVGQVEAALAEWKHLRRLYPLDLGLTLQIADALQAAGETEAAVREIRRALTVCPQNDWLYRRLGDLLAEQGNLAAAQWAYQQALQWAPFAFDLHERQRELEGRPTLRELVPLQEEMPAVDEADQRWPEAPAVLLLRETQFLVHPGGAAEARQHLLLYLRTAEGAKEWQRMPLPVGAMVEEAIIHGSRDEGRRTREADTASLTSDLATVVVRRQDEGIVTSGVFTWPPLQPGEVLELAWRRPFRPVPGLEGEFWYAHYFGSSRPTLRARLVIAVPETVPLQRQELGGNLTRREEQKEGWRIITWEGENLPGGVGPWVDVSSVGTWKRISEWYRHLTTPLLRLPPELKQQAAEVTVPHPLREDKIRALYEFASARLRPAVRPWERGVYLPRVPRDVLRSGEGSALDQAALLTVLLREIGTSAYLALVLAPTPAGVPFLPSPRFAYALVAVEKGENFRWLDPTSDLPLGELPRELAGAWVLVVRKGEENLRQIRQ